MSSGGWKLAPLNAVGNCNNGENATPYRVQLDPAAVNQASEINGNVSHGSSWHRVVDIYHLEREFCERKALRRALSFDTYATSKWKFLNNITSARTNVSMDRTRLSTLGRARYSTFARRFWLRGASREVYESCSFHLENGISNIPVRGCLSVGKTLFSIF